MAGLARVWSRAQSGMQSVPVRVEVDIGAGLPAVLIVGLPETAVREARDRVRAAITNSGFSFPEARITINLAPADLPKEGGRFDLPIAIGVLIASGQLPEHCAAGFELIGELALGGELRSVRAAIPAALAIRALKRGLIAPTDNQHELALVSDLDARVAACLNQVTAFLRQEGELPAPEHGATTQPPSAPDLRDVKGQHAARRALEIAAAGRHHLLLSGPPGTGKTLLASRLSGILPPLTSTQALEVLAIRSVAGDPVDSSLTTTPPLASPHHSASMTAIAGGGTHPRPGEVSRAHHGVLFLDELPEFERRALEVLREPIESGRIVISRVRGQCQFPASFQLVATMNPCPCGHLGDAEVMCRCGAAALVRYRQRLSGPLLDRIDLHVSVPRVPIDVLRGHQDDAVETSAEVRQRVVAARRRQLQRQGCANADLGGGQLDQVVSLSAECEQLLARAAVKLNLSARAIHRTLKVARSIADLAAEPAIAPSHLSEAIGLRGVAFVD